MCGEGVIRVEGEFLDRRRPFMRKAAMSAR